MKVVPDALVSRSVMQMDGSKNYNLLENSEDLCAWVQKVNAHFVAQDSQASQLQSQIAVRRGAKIETKGRQDHGRGAHRMGGGQRPR